MRDPASTPAATPFSPTKLTVPSSVVAIDHDLNHVAVAEFADRPACQRLGRDVTHACARRHAAEPRVSDDGDMFAERQMPQRARDLVGLFHAGAHRPSANQHEHIARRNLIRFDCSHRGRL